MKRIRLEIRTPGKLPNRVTIDSMKIGGSHVFLHLFALVVALVYNVKFNKLV